MPLELVGSAVEIGSRCDKLREDQLALRASRERLGQGEETVQAAMVERDHEDRALRPGGLPRLERRIVTQDCPLELAQCLPGLDAQLLDEHAASALVDVERLRLPAGPVQRE